MWGTIIIQSKEMATTPHGSPAWGTRVDPGSVSPGCLTLKTHHKWGHSSRRNRPTDQVCINVPGEWSPTNHWNKDHHPLWIPLPSESTTTPGPHSSTTRSAGSLGTPALSSPTLMILMSYCLFQPSFLGRVVFAAQNKKGKVGLPGEQSLVEVFLIIKCCSHAHKLPI